MIDFLEICERALNGPIMTESDFDMKVFVPKLSQVIKRYVVVGEPVVNAVSIKKIRKDKKNN